jgi:hypothetical protein
VSVSVASRSRLMHRAGLHTFACESTEDERQRCPPCFRELCQSPSGRELVLHLGVF